ncbi:MAG TPA: DUF6220 domain-containing protein [Phototrophicaceae bacterium]|jgi:hypothetical protein|nr:DUF6220 domain-containing protein [Phototrophicaceae bacterium]
MQRTIAQIHPILARLFLAGLLLQFYLAGAGLFGVGTFQPHRMLGDALTVLSFLFLILAVVGRLGRKLIGLSILLALLTIVQVMLPSLRGSVSWIAALHPVNALALMGVSTMIRRSGRTKPVSELSGK